MQLVPGFNYQSWLGKITKNAVPRVVVRVHDTLLNLLYNLPSTIDVSERVLELKRSYGFHHQILSGEITKTMTHRVMIPLCDMVSQSYVQY